jgi:hypothetical protein
MPITEQRSAKEYAAGSFDDFRIRGQNRIKPIRAIFKDSNPRLLNYMTAGHKVTWVGGYYRQKAGV